MENRGNDAFFFAVIVQFHGEFTAKDLEDTRSSVVPRMKESRFSVYFRVNFCVLLILGFGVALQIAVKSCKQINKNLSDMGKELESIGQVCSVGDLPEKLLEAEEAKVQVEGQLLERVGYSRSISTSFNFVNRAREIACVR